MEEACLVDVMQFDMQHTVTLICNIHGFAVRSCQHELYGNERPFCGYHNQVGCDALKTLPDISQYKSAQLSVDKPLEQYICLSAEQAAKTAMLTVS